MCLTGEQQHLGVQVDSGRLAQHLWRDGALGAIGNNVSETSVGCATDIGGTASAGPSLVEPLSSGRAVEPAAGLLTEPVAVLCEDPGRFAGSSTWEWVLALDIFDNTVTLALDTEDLE